MTRKAAKAPPGTSSKKKPSVVRDGYSMPKEDHDLIEKIRDRCWDSKPNKSEVLRAALIALHAMKDKPLHDAMAKVVRLKPGRDPEELQTK